MPTKTYSARGADMGRISHYGKAYGKFSLRRIRLDSGGYDSGGAYWGLGAPLWNAVDDTGSADLFFRARDREHAKEQVRTSYPEAEFYR